MAWIAKISAEASEGSALQRCVRRLERRITELLTEELYAARCVRVAEVDPRRGGLSLSRSSVLEAERGVAFLGRVGRKQSEQL